MTLFANEIHNARQQEKNHGCDDTDELKGLHVNVEPPPDSSAKINGDLQLETEGGSPTLRHRTASLTEETVIT